MGKYYHTLYRKKYSTNSPENKVKSYEYMILLHLFLKSWFYNHDNLTVVNGMDN